MQHTKEQRLTSWKPLQGCFHPRGPHNHVSPAVDQHALPWPAVQPHHLPPSCHHILQDTHGRRSSSSDATTKRALLVCQCNHILQECYSFPKADAAKWQQTDSQFVQPHHLAPLHHHILSQSQLCMLMLHEKIMYCDKVYSSVDLVVGKTAALHCAALHWIVLQCTALHCTSM